MLWPLALPAQLTLALMAIVWVVTIPWLTKKSWTGLLVVPAWGFWLFVPTCLLMMTAMAPFRFGLFEYAEYAAIGDEHVCRSLPTSAKAIVVDQQEFRNRARYQISLDDLKAWHEARWTASDWSTNEGISSRAPADRPQRSDNRNPQAEEFAHLFGGLSWSMPDDAVQYSGPATSRGAGYTIWYSPSQEVAYHYTSY
jgi:hypothetical protein